MEIEREKAQKATPDHIRSAAADFQERNRRAAERERQRAAEEAG